MLKSIQPLTFLSLLEIIARSLYLYFRPTCLHVILQQFQNFWIQNGPHVYLKTVRNSQYVIEQWKHKYGKLYSLYNT